MAACPCCQRPVALARSRCLYCGRELPAEILAAVADAAEASEAWAEGVAPEPPPPEADRVLLILDLEGAEPLLVARALGLSAYEAAQRIRRRGPQLHRIAPPEEAAREVDRLAAEGLRVTRVPGTEARAGSQPLVATGGRREEGALDLRCEEGGVRLTPGDVLLVVKGHISREYQPSPEGRRVRTATLEAGFRVHVHRYGDVRPVELDPGSFDFGERGATGSSLFRLVSWVEGLYPGAPVDDGFRLLPPALGIAAATRGIVGAAETVSGKAEPRSASSSKTMGPVILDNLQQFRFYSSWRAAVERRQARRSEG